MREYSTCKTYYFDSVDELKEFLKSENTMALWLDLYYSDADVVIIDDSEDKVVIANDAWVEVEDCHLDNIVGVRTIA